MSDPTRINELLGPKPPTEIEGLRARLAEEEARSRRLAEKLALQGREIKRLEAGLSASSGLFFDLPFPNVERTKFAGVRSTTNLYPGRVSLCPGDKRPGGGCGQPVARTSTGELLSRCAWHASEDSERIRQREQSRGRGPAKEVA